MHLLFSLIKFNTFVQLQMRNTWLDALEILLASPEGRKKEAPRRKKNVIKKSRRKNKQSFVTQTIVCRSQRLFFYALDWRHDNKYFFGSQREKKKLYFSEEGVEMMSQWVSEDI